MKLWPPFLRKNSTPTPALGVRRDARLQTPPAPARPTPVLGTASAGSGEYSRFEQIMMLLRSPENRLPNARKAIIGFHDMLRDRSGCPNLANELIARTVGLYRETNYLCDRLRTSVTGAELKLVEHNVRDFIALLANPMVQLPREVRQQMAVDEPYARFLAGLFALARGRHQSALEHFTRAAASPHSQDFRAWGVNPETIIRSLQQGLNDQAVTSLGRLFRQLADRLPVVDDTPAPALDMTGPVHLTPLPQPVFPIVGPVRTPGAGAPATTYVLKKGDLSSGREQIARPISPNTSSPRTRRG